MYIIRVHEKHINLNSNLLYLSSAADISLWLKKYGIVNNRHYFFNPIFEFNSKEDAILFALIWSIE